MSQEEKELDPRVSVASGGRDINLSGQTLTGERFSELLEVLETNTIRFLNLSSCEIGDEEVKKIADALLENTSIGLIELDLSQNHITDVGAEVLAELLESNILSILNLYGNDGTEYEDGGVGSEGAKAIAEALETNTSLAVLNLGWCMIGDEGVKAVAQALKTNTSLTELDLTNSIDSCDGAKPLGNALCFNHSLRVLTLNVSAIGKKEAKSIARGLTSNTSLTVLNLENCGIDDNGVIALAKALRCNTTLINLDLSNGCDEGEDNNVSDAGAESLISAFEVNTTLTNLGWEVRDKRVRGNRTDDTNISKKLLKKLNFLLARNKSIPASAKAACVVTKGIFGMGESSKLAESGLVGLVIDHAGLLPPPAGGALAAFADGIRKTSSGSVEIEEKKEESDAHAVVLNAKTLTAEKLAKLRRDLETNTVKSISLTFCDIGDRKVRAIARALQKNTSLIELNLSHNDIGDDGIIAIYEALEVNKTLTKLDLSFNRLGEKAFLLFQTLNNAALAVLNLRGNGIGDDSVAVDIAESLIGASVSFVELDLSDNRISHVGTEGIAWALTLDPSGDRTAAPLTTLNLSRNPIGNEGAKAISEALKTNTRLTTLHLEVCGIDNDGANALITALEINNTSLITLKLGGNNINKEVLERLDLLLERNKNMLSDGFSPFRPKASLSDCVVPDDSKGVELTRINNEETGERVNARVFENRLLPLRAPSGRSAFPYATAVQPTILDREFDASMQVVAELSELTQQREITKRRMDAYQERGAAIPAQDERDYNSLSDRIAELESGLSVKPSVM